jgi:hypothetical protein
VRNATAYLCGAGLKTYKILSVKVMMMIFIQSCAIFNLPQTSLLPFPKVLGVIIGVMK